ncbi:hypothetical protein D3C80_1892170 [compost metagenome]
MYIHDAQPEMSFTRVKEAGTAQHALFIVRNPVLSGIQMAIDVNKQPAAGRCCGKDGAHAVALIPGIGRQMNQLCDRLAITVFRYSQLHLHPPPLFRLWVQRNNVKSQNVIDFIFTMSKM